ncbi:hypothetical protein [Spirosoma sp. 209]|uniref:hypothetical protein n=1 Tax=Spirosoma sp. 209 TaxID=1955701 RepID=UPI00098D18C3|nr:hypothetical protein [Spirosoma sp. 209]
MKQSLFLFLLAIIAVNCTHSETSPDIAENLVGNYVTTQIDMNQQGWAVEGGIFTISDGQITVTRAASSLEQVNLTFSYTTRRVGTSITTRSTDTELIELQQVKGDNRIHFKSKSDTYLGFWSNQDGRITGRYLNKSFTATKQ